MVENKMKNNESNVGYYEDYIKKILDVACLSTKENSVLIGLTIEDGKCRSTVELLEQNGKRDIGRSVAFSCTESFYTNFLERLVVEYSDTTNTVVADIVDVDGDDQFTFRMVSENNDMFTVDGISKDYARKLKEKVENREKEKVYVKSSEAGLSNALGLTVLISLIVVIFLTLLMFVW